MERQEAFTIKANGISNRLITSVIVRGPDGKEKQFPALIDTGATHTCVSTELANEMGLVSVAVTENRTAGGVVKDVNVYVVDLIIGNTRILLSKWKVVQTNLTAQEGIEMLIGMDLLNNGDFMVTNSKGVTMASFRVPSLLSADFVPTAIRENAIVDERERRERNQRAGKKRRKR